MGCAKVVIRIYRRSCLYKGVVGVVIRGGYQGMQLIGRQSWSCEGGCLELVMRRWSYEYIAGGGYQSPKLVVGVGRMKVVAEVCHRSVATVTSELGDGWSH